MIPKPQHMKASAIQPSTPLAIIFTLHLMLPAINFNDQLLFKAHKIDDVSANWRLPAEFMTEKFPSSDGLPELAFGVCHVFAEGFGVLVGCGHFTPSPALPRQGGGRTQVPPLG